MSPSSSPSSSPASILTLLLEDQADPPSKRQRLSSPTDQFTTLNSSSAPPQSSYQSRPHSPSPSASTLEALQPTYSPCDPSSPHSSAPSPVPSLTNTPLNESFNSQSDIGGLGTPSTPSPDRRDLWRTDAAPASTSESGEIMVNHNWNEVIQDLEQQNHMHNDPGARQRGESIINFAKMIIHGPRGSPTAKNKVQEAQKIVHKVPILGESDFQEAMLRILVNESRTLRKPGAISKQNLDDSDFEPEPRLFDDDYLGRRTRANFPPDGVPQTKASAQSFQQKFNSYPKIAFPVPDVVWGISEGLLIAKQKHLKDVLENSDVPQLARQLYLPFLCGEFKSGERPIAEAIVGVIRDGACMVWNKHQWNCKVSGQTVPRSQFDVPPMVDVTTHTSKPDMNSICFSTIIDPQYTDINVHWREEWSNGVNWFHTSLLETYNIKAGFDKSTEDYLTAVTNILDWGSLERTPTIFEDAKQIARAAMKNPTLDFPLPEPKRQKRS